MSTLLLEKAGAPAQPLGLHGSRPVFEVKLKRLATMHGFGIPQLLTTEQAADCPATPATLTSSQVLVPDLAQALSGAPLQCKNQTVLAQCTAIIAYAILNGTCRMQNVMGYQAAPNLWTIKLPQI